MREHIVIRRPEYVAGTAERPEVGVFTQASVRARPAPWGRIAAGDIVWMKWSGGPVVAQAKVAGYRQLESCTPDQLRLAVAGYTLHDLDAYWSSLAPRFHAVAVYLERERWLDEIVETASRSHGASWLVFEDAAARSAWLETRPAPKPLPRDPRGPRVAGARLRFLVFRRDGYSCQYCGRSAPEFPLHVDHIVPWSKGGATVFDNLRTACRACNLGKRDSHI